MGGTSEREYSEKLQKVIERLNKRVKDVQKDFDKIEKIKVDALKKVEDMRRYAEKEVNKIEKNIAKSKDLAPESKQRLESQIVVARNETEGKYSTSRRQIAESIIPVAA
ncbi:MAG: hypothetical protein OEY24_05180 [Candidatus Bathyarchaeota archaeon]|nr:hypothetical protein [Candidatus Bathyarchaeota archaeon]MDH5495075.1 hypothetical protein [Candidatus Bathyarchaeota archaeon]